MSGIIVFFTISIAPLDSRALHIDRGYFVNSFKSLIGDNLFFDFKYL